MAPRQGRLTDAELTVLEALWKLGPQTIRALTAKLYPGESTSDYATVQKLLERLEAKRCVARDRSGHAHVFRAAVDREHLIDESLAQMAERLCEGSLTPVLMQLARRVRLSEQDREELRQLLAESKQRPRGRRP